jgi:hypothetical protein
VGVAEISSEAIPVMVGGVTQPALRRAARVADHWQAFGLTPEEFQTRRADLDRLSAPRQLSAGILLSRLDSGKPVAELLDLLRRWHTAGADEVTIHFGPSAQTSTPMIELMDRWHSEHEM